MRKLIKKTIIIVVMMLSINIGIGLWLQHQVTLSLEKEASLQHVAVDLALMMASEARMERSMTALGEDPKKKLPSRFRPGHPDEGPLPRSAHPS